jgi:Zn-dependent protease with chaperone function
MVNLWRQCLAAILLAGLYAVGAAVAAFDLVIVSLPIVLYLALRYQLPAGKYSGALVAAASALIFGTVLTLSLSAIANGFRAVRHMGEPWRSISLPGAGAEPLRDLIAEVSAKLGTSAPHELRITAAPNAAVTEGAWRVGMPAATRTLYIGLPLLAGMSTGELRAVIGHEMAHYAGGHARTSMLMHRGVVTIDAIRGGLQLLIVTPPKRRSVNFRPLMMLSWWFLYGYALVGYWAFTAYWALYWRLSFAVRRGQEYDADRGAAPIVGAAGLGGALRRAQGVAEAWGRFHREFVLPMRRAGYTSPETFDAFGRMITDGAYRETARAWEGELAGQSTAPTDTHPCLADRLARLGSVGAARRDPVGPPAMTLVPALAEGPGRAFLTDTLGRNGRLTAASWDECLRRVGQQAGHACQRPAGTLVIAPSAASRDVLGPWPDVEEVWRSLGTVARVAAFVAMGVLGLYLGHTQQQFQARVDAAEHRPLSVPTISSERAIIDFQQAVGRQLQSLSPTFLLPHGLPSVSVPLFTTVTVRPGDTLSLIACQHSTTVAALQSLNHLGSSTAIKVGQRLTVPDLAATTAACG